MKLANGLKIAAVTISCLYFAFLIIGDMFQKGSNVSILLYDAMILGGYGVMIWFSWKSPRYGGLLMIVFVIGFLIYPMSIGGLQSINKYTVALVTPLLLAGILFFLAAMKTPKTKA